MTKDTKKDLITMLRAEISLERTLTIIKERIHFYYHYSKLSEAELLECERIAQEEEL